MNLTRFLSFRWLRTRATKAAAWERRFGEGRIALREGRALDTLQSWEGALREAEGFGPDDPRLGATLSSLARLYALEGRPAQAEGVLRRALALKEASLGPRHPDLATILDDLAAALRAQGREDEAAAHRARALTILEERIGPDFAELSESLRRAGITKVDD